MKTFVSFVCFVGLLFGAGCATVSRQALAEASLQTATHLAAGRLLREHPDRLPLARDLAAAIDAATSSAVTLTPEAIAAFVERVCAPHHVPPAEVAEWVGLAQAIHRTYVDTFESAAVTMADPRVLALARAFQRGLASAAAAGGPHGSSL